MSEKTNECRVCLETVNNFKEFTDDFTQDTDYLYPQRKETISTAFEFCTNLNISEDLDAPLFLCLPCTRSLKFSYDFIRQAKQADSNLRKVLIYEEEDSQHEEAQEFIKLEDAYVLIEDSEKQSEEEKVHFLESPESSTPEDLIEEEYVIQNEEEGSEEEYILEVNDDISLEPFVMDTSIQETSSDKTLLKNKKYVSRKDIPANFSCSLCPKSFVHNFLLKAHINQSHNPVSRERCWQCDKCDKSFFRKEVLSRHLLTVHREGRDYKCTICGKEFQYKERLTRHLRIHVDRRFQCTVCDKRYVQNADLNVHMRTHTNEKPYQCTQCDEAFPNKSRLTVHVNRKHLCLIYKCKYCSVYECKSYGSMRRHEIEHLKCPFQCPKCKRGFSRKKRFQEHMKQSHALEMTEEEISNMYIRNMNEAKRMELELKGIESGEPTSVNRAQEKVE